MASPTAEEIKPGDIIIFESRKNGEVIGHYQGEVVANNSQGRGEAILDLKVSGHPDGDTVRLNYGSFSDNVHSINGVNHSFYSGDTPIDVVASTPEAKAKQSSPDKFVKSGPPKVGDGVIVKHNETGELRAGEVDKVLPHNDVIHVKNPDGSITDLHLRANADHFKLIHGGPAKAAEIVRDVSKAGGLWGHVAGAVVGPLIVAGATLASGGGVVAAAEAGIKTAGDEIMDPIEAGARVKEEASKGNWKEAGIEAARYFDPGLEAFFLGAAESGSVTERLPLSPEVMTEEFTRQNPELVAMSLAYNRIFELSQKLVLAERDHKTGYNELDELRNAHAEALANFRDAYDQFKEHAENNGQTVGELVQATLGDKTPDADIAQKQPEQGSSVDRVAGVPSTVPVGGGPSA